LFNNFLKFLIR